MSLSLLLWFAVLKASSAAILDEPSQPHILVAVGANISLACNASEPVQWQKNGLAVTETDKRYVLTETKPDAGAVADKAHALFLDISGVRLDDTGNFSCRGRTSNVTQAEYFVQAVLPPRVRGHSPVSIKLNMTKSATLFCLLEMSQVELFERGARWKLEEGERGKDEDVADFVKLNAAIQEQTVVQRVNETMVNVTLHFDGIMKKHNGTYICSVERPAHLDEEVKMETWRSTILVMDVPYVAIDFMKAVGAHKIFINWTLNDGNDPVKHYYLQYMKEGTPTYKYYMDRISGNYTAFVFQGFAKDSKYRFKLSAQNSQGIGPYYDHPAWVQTLDKDPTFVPKIEVKGNTHSTITIGWHPPPTALLEYIHYYELVASHPGNKSSVEEAVHPQNSRNLPYMFDNLRVASEYSFKVRACSELTHECGNWSEEVTGMTMDGVSSAPLNVRAQCIHSNISRRNEITVEWDAPTTPNGQLINYNVVLDGLALYRSERGSFRNETWGPKIKSPSPDQRRAVFEGVPPNTNYTITVSGVTRSKRPGEPASVSCSMPPTVPDVVGRFLWGKVQDDEGDWIFKLFLPRTSERNGPICCYRVYLVRLPSGESSQRLPRPDDLDVITYGEAHAANNSRGGAYIAEILTTENFQSEIFLGDGRQMESLKDEERANGACKSCFSNLVRKVQRRTKIELPVEDDEEASGDAPAIAKVEEEKSRKRRETVAKANNQTVMTINPTVHDGQLNLANNYTGFVEVIVENHQTQEGFSAFSEYFETMKAGAPEIPDANADELAAILNIVVTILCGLILVVLLLLMTLCLLHRYYSKNAQADETYTLTDSLRAFCYGRGASNQHRHLIASAPSKPPDLPPISKLDFPAAYMERHKDSDYGFQHEFELLPDRFSDRTTKNSDAKENLYKNRYPDIKAYDQTRVKLSMINSTIGSDYINANFVLGYKERKKFICAQGPMENTLNDFWRMIWEQHLEIIVMLTNLEEYNKSKCAKYWPEKQTPDSTHYGDYSVMFASESRFSDYLIRELKVTKKTNSADENDQPRIITQYHYLNWKDFMAPEHPQGIIKFIRQINAVYSVQRGPILVHCSAGVGRSGSLVALDSMIQQLEEEGQVSVFNTICDLRHQRNFLVQSLKQYIFLYRALLELSQFGDTEIPYKGLSATIETLKQPANNSKGQCKLEIEFEKIKSAVDDIKKTCAVGQGEENTPKNRSAAVIPFDRNRVILSPIPSREHSTYINASFMEGYDNKESFIITQDPMENTIADFWRMVSEQSINTLVMISEIADTKCPRYWADDEIQYEHIKVKYIQSESGPYYTRREFIVTNLKIDDALHVTQFQYQGWPTVEGEVPEVTRGMIEIVNQAQKHHNAQQNKDQYSQPGPIAVHCNLGTDRSSIFVAMCILVQQLRLEKRIDICTTVRKLRAQRNQMIDSYAQYEFLHRAIVNYADLHKSSLESLASTTDSC